MRDRTIKGWSVRGRPREVVIEEIDNDTLRLTIVLHAQNENHYIVLVRKAELRSALAALR